MWLRVSALESRSLAVVDCQRLFEIVIIVGDVGSQKEDGDTL
jgi:hypothetical protein